MRSEFDIRKLADNGMRRGRTTGTCAAAAAKAAAMLLLHDKIVQEVAVELPNKQCYLRVPINSVQRLLNGGTRAEVIKEAGDDPDATDGATIFCILKYNDDGTVRFLGGPGVGTVTEPGIRVPVGEPAINPVPRSMIQQAVVDVLGDDTGLDITIGCVNGEEIARKTFNPRLGIQGGISILGTTGIVEPMSLAAYMASIEVYLKVSLADSAQSMAILPGNIGLGFASKTLGLPRKRVVHISNYIGFALDQIEQLLSASRSRLPQLWVLGHPGKLAKILNGDWDTHSRVSGMAMGAIAGVARKLELAPSLCERMSQANTVEDIVQLLKGDMSAEKLWGELELAIAKVMHERAPTVDQLNVRLFDMQGEALAGGRADVVEERFE